MKELKKMNEIFENGDIDDFLPDKDLTEKEEKEFIVFKNYQRLFNKNGNFFR